MASRSTSTRSIEPYERVLNSQYPGLQGKDELTLEDLKGHDKELESMERDLRVFRRNHVPAKSGG
jgi:hypothetical protein